MYKYFLRPICSKSIVKVLLDINILLLIVIKKQEYKKREPDANSFEKTLDLSYIKREALSKKRSFQLRISSVNVTKSAVNLFTKEIPN